MSNEGVIVTKSQRTWKFGLAGPSVAIWRAVVRIWNQNEGYWEDVAKSDGNFTSEIAYLSFDY